ncbi:uncharacterized protein MONBRDRAFT_39257 [Monosiga brevicollis MX1]|uniref:Sulfatase N-terminal domain-containing protein n=1 Tax=Monosiga brevicollis TaxID=81824 RepID=A9VDA4_MONBE|nr:uncharacterized protein MONBRDRAFT_39257 [Monosiga brevicollis MX1]EDQ84495.1 predicted protein [Monosiga brevicollis MX1]|eukprot:XP_001750682.1 hypothetical protein [Monosiga brevicollis MX1]
MAMGAAHYVVCTSDRKLYTCCVDGCTGTGENSEDLTETTDEAGRNVLDSHGNVMTPIPVPFFKNQIVTEVACGDRHVMARLENQLYAWGCGEYGRLGLGDEDDRFEPTLVPLHGDITIARLACGPEATILVTDTGYLLAAGHNVSNRFGLNAPITVISKLRKTHGATESGETAGSMTSLSLRCQDDRRLTKAPPSVFLQVAIGNEHIAMVDRQGRIVTCGSNLYGQLGTPDKRAHGDGPRLVRHLLHTKVRPARDARRKSLEQMRFCVCTIDAHNVVTVAAHGSSSMVLARQVVSQVEMRHSSLSSSLSQSVFNMSLESHNSFFGDDEESLGGEESEAEPELVEASPRPTETTNTEPQTANASDTETSSWDHSGAIPAWLAQELARERRDSAAMDRSRESDVQAMVKHVVLTRQESDPFPMMPAQAPRKAATDAHGIPGSYPDSDSDSDGDESLPDWLRNEMDCEYIPSDRLAQRKHSSSSTSSLSVPTRRPTEVLNATMPLSMHHDSTSAHDPQPSPLSAPAPMPTASAGGAALADLMGPEPKLGGLESLSCIVSVSQSDGCRFPTKRSDPDMNMAYISQPKLQELIMRQGVSMAAMMASTPVCCPSRSGIQTGRYIHNVPAKNNSIAGNCSGPLWRENAEKKNFATYLHAAGLVPPWSMGFEPAHDIGRLVTFLNWTMHCVPFIDTRRITVASISTPMVLTPMAASAFFPPAGLTGRASSATRTSSFFPEMLPSAFLLHSQAMLGHWDRIYYHYTISNNGQAEKHGDDPEADYLPKVLQRKAMAFLENVTSSDDNAPFFMMVATPSCHDPTEPAAEYAGLMVNATAPRTPNYGGFASDKHWYAAQQNCAAGHCDGYTKQQEAYNDLQYRRRALTLMSVDDIVGNITFYLESKRLLDNTYIFYSSDHGYHLGQFALMKDKRNPYESDIRIPGLARGPGIAPGTILNDPVTLVDFAPTFLDIAGIPIPDTMDGISMLPGLHAAGQQGREPLRVDFLVEYHGEGISATAETNVSQCKVADMFCSNADTHCAANMDSTYLWAAAGLAAVGLAASKLKKTSKDPAFKTGGHGSLGSNVVEALLARGETHITVVDIQDSSLFEAERADGRVTFRQCNLCKPSEVHEALQGADVVIHTAAAVNYWSRFDFEYDAIKAINYDAACSVIDACLQHDVRVLVHISSTSVVVTPETLKAGTLCNLDEDNTEAVTKGPFVCHYVKTKAMAERAVLEANGTGRLHTVAVRPGGIYGPHDRLFLGTIYTNQPGLSPSDNEVTAHTYSENIAHACLLASDAILQSPAARCAGKAYFVTDEPNAGDEPMKTGPFYNRLYAMMGHKREIVPDFVRNTLPGLVDNLIWLTKGAVGPHLGDLAKLRTSVVLLASNNFYFRDDKARRDFGYKPRYTQSQAMERTTAFWRKELQASGFPVRDPLPLE